MAIGSLGHLCVGVVAGQGAGLEVALAVQRDSGASGGFSQAGQDVRTLRKGLGLAASRSVACSSLRLAPPQALGDEGQYERVEGHPLGLGARSQLAVDGLRHTGNEFAGDMRLRAGTWRLRET